MAQIYELQISLNSKSTSMRDLAGGGRVDLRLGWDAKGELYVFEKIFGKIYQVTGLVVDEEAQGVETDVRSLMFNDAAPSVDPSHVVVAEGRAPMIDDMEDGNLIGIEEEGRHWKWWEYDRSSGGSKTMEVVESSDAPGEGTRALRIKRSGGGRWKTYLLVDFVGLSKSRKHFHYDATAYDGIRFWAKAKGTGMVQLYVGTPITEPVSRDGLCYAGAYACYNGYRYTLDLSEQWRQLTIPFTSLEQVRPPFDGPFAGDPLKTILFPIRTNEDFEFWVDDLSFYRDE